MSALAAFAVQFFQIRPEELKRTLLCSVYLFFCIGAFIVARICRTVLFLEIPNYRDQLPLTYLGIALSVSLVMYAYARVERLLRRDLTNGITLVALMLGTLGFRAVLSPDALWAYWAFYVWVEVFGTFLVVQFWSLANEIFHARQAKRPFAVVAGGGVLANVAFGFGTSGAAKLLGTENLLFGICGCVAVCLAMVVQLSKTARAELTAAHERRPKAAAAQGGPPHQASGVFATRHVQLIAAVIVLTYWVSTLVDYQFQVIVGDSIAGKDARSEYFGTFFGLTGILAAGIQFFFTSKILERGGVLVALMLLPLTMLGGSIGLVAMPGLGLAAFTKGSENVLRYTINDSTLQLLYLPVPSYLRGRAKAILDGILKPLAIGSAGLVLTLLVGQLEKMLGIPLGLHWPVTQLSYVVAGALVLWGAATVALKREYLASLVQTLQHRRLNFADAHFSIQDDSTLQTLGKSLVSERATDVVHALELLAFCDANARSGFLPAVVALLSHADELVREAALQYLATTESSTFKMDTRALQKLTIDPAPGVRAAAAQATCALLGTEAYELVHWMLEDPSLKVRAAAAVGLIRHSGLDGVLACADTLKRMLTHPEAAERREAAWILGEVGVQNFFQPLVPLLQDREAEVRRTAAISAGKLKSPGLLLPLAELVGQPRLGGAAVNALVGYGTQVLEPMRAMLDDMQRPAEVRAHVCRVLAKLPGGGAALVAHLDDPAWQVRAAAAAALAGLRAHQSSSPVPAGAIAAALRQQCLRAYELLSVQRDLQLDAQKTPLLLDALEHRLLGVRQQVLALLSLKYDAKTLELVGRNLRAREAAVRANAVEVLDNLLSKEEKPLVVPLFDEAPVERVLHAIQAIFPLGSQTRQERLQELLRAGDPWIQSVAAHAVGAWDAAALEPQVRALLHSPDPVCRETALWTLRRIGEAGQLPFVVEPLTHDPVAAVSRYAQHVLQQVVMRG